MRVGPSGLESLNLSVPVRSRGTPVRAESPSESNLPILATAVVPGTVD